MKLDSDEEVEQEHKNPVKRAEREREFKTAGMLKEVYRSAKDMHSAVQKYDKTFKTVSHPHPKHKQLTVTDFSLAARGPQEDEVYSQRPFFRNNVRRGNTILFDQKTKEVHWARKGLIKFFDLSDKIIKAAIEGSAVNLDHRDKPLYNAIFSEIEGVLSCNEELPMESKAKVHVYRLNKANGENAQVSYSPITDEWVISSKNVSIMIKDAGDIKLYEGERYGFAQLMARCWLEMIAGRKPADLRALKEELTNRTLVGEYCGNPDYQHLVKYADVTIFFYALVENTSTHSCLPPPETFAFLEKHHLPIVKNYEKALFGKFVDLEELGNALTKLFEDVATASIFDEEEGSVVYFVLEKPREFCEYVSDRFLQEHVPIPVDFKTQPVWWNVSALAKLKTLEYRILRKLREKLKFFTRLKKKGEENVEKKQNDQKKMEEKYGSFEKEVARLVKGRELSKPLLYFYCVAIVAFEYVFAHRKNQRNLALLSEHYLDFLSVIFWCIENKREVTPALMADEELHRELRGTTWQGYSVDIIQHYPELLDKLAPRYAKIKKSMGGQEAEGEEEPEVE